MTIAGPGIWPPTWVSAISNPPHAARQHITPGTNEGMNAASGLPGRTSRGDAHNRIPQPEPGEPLPRSAPDYRRAAARVKDASGAAMRPGSAPVPDTGPLLARTRHLRRERGANGPVSYALQTEHRTRNRRPKPG